MYIQWVCGGATTECSLLTTDDKEIRDNWPVIGWFAFAPTTNDQNYRSGGSVLSDYTILR